MSDSENPNTETGLSAESDYFDLVYNGDIVPDNDPEEVKARVAASFNLDTAAADQLFSGEPIRLKRGVDQFTAQRILKRLMDAGAAAKIVRVAKPEIIQKYPLALAPLGADVVDEAERARVPPAPLPDLDHLSLEPIGADIIEQAELPEVKKLNVDKSRFTLQ